MAEITDLNEPFNEGQTESFSRPPQQLNALDALRVSPYPKIMAKAGAVTLACIASLRWVGGDSYAAPTVDEQIEHQTYAMRSAMARPIDDCRIASVTDTVVFEPSGPRHHVTVRLDMHEDQDVWRVKQQGDDRVRWAPSRTQARLVPDGAALQGDEGTSKWQPEQVTPLIGPLDAVAVIPDNERRAGEEIAILLAHEVEVKNPSKGEVYRALGIKSCGALVARPNQGGTITWQENRASFVYVDKTVFARCAMGIKDATEVFCPKEYTLDARGAL